MVKSDKWKKLSLDLLLVNYNFYGQPLLCHFANCMNSEWTNFPLQS